MQLVVALTKYLVNGGVGGQSAVEDGELPLEPLRDVVAASSGMNHGCQKLHVHNVGELARFLQVVEAFLFHHLPDNLVGHLCREIDSLHNVAVLCVSLNDVYYMAPHYPLLTPQRGGNKVTRCPTKGNWTD